MDLSGQLPKFQDIILRRSLIGMWRMPNTCSQASEFLGDWETRDIKIHHFCEISDNFGYSAFLASLMNSPDVLDWTLISTEYSRDVYMELLVDQTVDIGLDIQEAMTTALKR